MKFIARTALTLLAIVLIARTASAQTVNNLTFNVQSAEAEFAHVDSTGCILTEIQVVASGQITKQTGQQKTNSPSCSVALIRFNLCTGTTLIFAQGITATQNFTIDNQLNTASVTATVPMNNGFDGVNFNLSVNLNWQATDALQKNKTKDNNLNGDPKVKITFRGDLRDAVANGNIAWSEGGDPM